jgi:hypothetical protein
MQTAIKKEAQAPLGTGAGCRSTVAVHLIVADVLLACSTGSRPLSVSDTCQYRTFIASWSME